MHTDIVLRIWKVLRLYLGVKFAKGLNPFEMDLPVQTTNIAKGVGVFWWFVFFTGFPANVGNKAKHRIGGLAGPKRKGDYVRLSFKAARTSSARHSTSTANTPTSSIRLSVA
jgi:hypothetical protein